jgi:hypothetical protein
VAHPQIATFARLADANAKPIRKLEGQKTLLGRTMHAVAYDEIHDEFMVPVPLSQSILIFRGAAQGDEAPIRVIQGPKTQLIEPERLAVDPVNNEIYVPHDDTILVFPRAANGDAAPVRILRGPDTGLGAGAVGVDTIRNLLVVGGGGGGQGGGSRFRIYDRTAQGNTKPKRVIGGPNSGFLSMGGPFAVYSPKGWIITTVRGRGELASNEAYLGIWNVEDEGDVPPRWRVGGPNGVFQMPRGVTIDAKNKSIIASDKRLNAVMTFYFPEAF